MPPASDKTFLVQANNYIYNMGSYTCMKNEADKATPLIGTVPRWMADYIKTKKRGYLSRLMRIAIQNEFDADKKTATADASKYIGSLILKWMQKHWRKLFTKTELKEMLWKNFERDMVNIKCNKDDTVNFALSELVKRKEIERIGNRYKPIMKPWDSQGR